jgi:hypothetical protein
LAVFPRRSRKIESAGSRDGENVPQLLRSPEFKEIWERLDDLGFKYRMAHVLCAANYGDTTGQEIALLSWRRVERRSRFRSQPILSDVRAKRIAQMELSKVS